MVACDPQSAAQPHQACPEEAPAESALFPKGPPARSLFGLERWWAGVAAHSWVRHLSTCRVLAAHGVANAGTRQFITHVTRVEEECWLSG